MLPEQLPPLLGLPAYEFANCLGRQRLRAGTGTGKETKAGPEAGAEARGRPAAEAGGEAVTRAGPGLRVEAKAGAEAMAVAGAGLGVGPVPGPWSRGTCVWRLIKRRSSSCAEIAMGRGSAAQESVTYWGDA